MAEPLLSVTDLVTSFHTDEGMIRAVDGVSFDVQASSTLGIVGESGCGKSVTSLSIMGLLPDAGVVEKGSAIFDGVDLLKLSERDMRGVRGKQISMVFQEPMTSLNPVYRVGSQIVEAIRAHQKVGRTDARGRAVELLQRVGIPDPSRRVDAYPHELSGGMRQRVMIAIALAGAPKLLIADEPTTALDVTIQAQILDLLRELREDSGMSVMLVTHDLGVVAEFADSVLVMYAGKVVEVAPTPELFRSPRHPYTRGLLRSIPGYGEPRADRRLPTIQGSVPDLRTLDAGCRFRDRCAEAIDRCAELEPTLEGAEHRVACFVDLRAPDA